MSSHSLQGTGQPNPHFAGQTQDEPMRGGPTHIVIPTQYNEKILIQKEHWKFTRNTSPWERIYNGFSHYPILKVALKQ